MPPDEERLFIALYTDADVHAKLAAEIRKHGFDARSAVEAGNTKLKDESQLEFAAAHGRAILTHNVKDFEPLYRKWQKKGSTIRGSLFRNNGLSANCCGESCDW